VILLVSYDLKGAAGSYQGLIDVLKGEQSWWRYMKSPWLVATNDSPEELYDKLKPFLRAGDRILVVQFQRPYQGWLPRKAWDWIHKYED
jgi:hypothetical protein